MADEDIQREPEPPEARPEPEPYRRPPPPGYYDDAFVRRRDPVESFIPSRNMRGLLAYYLGVFSFIPCLGLFLGPAALILGILGVRYRNRNPAAGGVGHAISGIVMGSITGLANWGVVIFVTAAIIYGGK